MKVGPNPTRQMHLVTPRAIRNYAQASGWKLVPAINGTIAVYHRPDSDLHQVIVPLDPTFDDYAESVAEAVRKLAAFEQVQPSQVLDHLLLPPADVLRFQESSEEASDNTIPLDHAVSMVEGLRRSILAVAHSVLAPLPYHLRLSKAEAEQFVQRCRFGQTERGSFTFQVACPVDQPSDADAADPPFGRRVTEGFMTVARSIALASDVGGVDRLLRDGESPLLSANLCEAMLSLRPHGERSKLRLSSDWSRAIPTPSRMPNQVIEYDQTAFSSLEYLTPRLRQAAEPKEEVFMGYVEGMKGQADRSNRMFGEVVFSLVLESHESIRSRAELPPDLYSAAGKAHLANAPVFFRGTLIRGARNHRIESIADFRIVTEPDDGDGH